MVSKVAVMALVAVVAIPILLGYAFNIEEVTETDYKATGEAVNVTQLLQNGIDYSYAHGDSYQINTKFATGANPPIMPVYESYTTNKTSFPATLYLAATNYYPAGSYNFTSYTVYFWQFSYNVNNCHIDINIVKNDNSTTTVTNVHTVYFDYSSTNNLVKMSRYTGYDTLAAASVSDVKYVTYTVSGSWYAESYQIYNSSSTNKYADLSSGFHFTGSPDNWWIKFPSNTISAILTIDLNSITDSSYSIKIGAAAGSYTLEKSTTGGQVSWLIRDVSDPARTIDLYYDQSRSSNTYQIYWDLKQTTEDSNYIYYSSHREFRYVGNWPNSIGEANIFLKYTDDKATRSPAGYPISFESFDFSQSSNGISPTMRVDDAYFRAYEYLVVKDQLYTPSYFKTNPITTISEIHQFGSSFTFGGNTYTVTEGNITLGSHKVPVNGLQLSSVPNINGGYDNKIGNTVISNTSQPSTITFNGSWSASISTQSLESYTYTEMEWKAGSFAWDGIDHNFLIVGLITCLGVFIGCGIYARKSRSGGIIPLMIITGCAAFVFFIML